MWAITIACALFVTETPELIARLVIASVESKFEQLEDITISPDSSLHA